MEQPAALPSHFQASGGEKIVNIYDVLQLCRRYSGIAVVSLIAS